MDKLTASLEDYLEVICNYTDEHHNLRAIDISKKLKVSRASVTEALKKLADKGLIKYDRYETIALTPKGAQIGQTVVSKHNILQDFFEKTLGLSKEEASANACKIEHVITENAFNKISDFLNKWEYNEKL